MARYKYVNMSTVTAYLPDPRGGRIALAPGQFVTDPYYERFARLPDEADNSGRSLIKVVVSSGRNHSPFEEIPRPQVTFRGPVMPGKVTPPPTKIGGKCLTACEASCMSIVEFSLSMEAEERKEPKLEVPEVFEQEKTESTITDACIQPVEVTTEERVESRVESSISVGESQETPSEAPGEKSKGVVSADDTKVDAQEIPPPAEKKPSKKTVEITTDYLLEKYGFTREDIINETADYVYVVGNGTYTYLSKLDPEFTCHNRPAILKHIKSKKKSNATDTR